MTVDDQATLRGGSRWRSVAIATVVALGAVALVGAFALVDVLRAADDLRVAQDRLESVDALVDAGRLAEASAELDVAYEAARRANDRLYGGPALDLARRLPVLSPNIASLRSSVGVGLNLIDGGRRVLAAGAPLSDEDGNFEVPLSGGNIPTDAVRDVRVQLAASSVSLPRLGEQPADAWLFGPVERLQDEVYREAESRADQFRSVADALVVAEELSGGRGPRRFLIAVANSAEMRGTGGMVLSYGVLDAADGDFELGAFGRIDELALASPIPPEEAALPEDYLRRWSGFDVTRRWRNATMSADLPLVAPTLMAMFEQATETRADGVIQIDPVGLAAILEGTGPVVVPELGQVSAADVVDLTLNEAYFRFPGIDERSDVLSDVAEATFDRLVEGDYPSLRPLAEALLDASAGGHVAMYSRSAEVQQILGRFGADNALPPPEAEYVHLGVQNVAGNKLDYYVDVGLELRGARLAGRVGAVRATVDVANDAPAGATEPRYVFGPFDENQRAGVYRGIVTLYLPRGTSLGDVRGETENPPVVQSEDGRTVVSYTIAVDPQTVSRVELDLELPPRPFGEYRLVAVPAARVRPTAFEIELDVGAGAGISEALPLRGPLVFAPGAGPVPLHRP